MDNITSISELKDAIELLEIEQEVKVQQLRQQFQETYENLKPINLLKSAVKEISSTPLISSNLLGMTTGVGLGFLARNIVIGASGGVFRKIIGTILQFSVTNFIARHPTEIKSIGQLINKSLFGRRK